MAMLVYKAGYHSQFFLGRTCSVPILPFSQEALYPTQEPGSAERETFISLVKRRRVCMMHFLGPKTGTLGQGESDGRPDGQMVRWSDVGW